jgi:transcriptional regulatory protein RtcR
MGSDREVESDFQLVAGTNRDLRTEVAAGRFREDLFARINLWSYVLPGLAQRPEDIEPNVDYLLMRVAAELGGAVRFTKEAKAAYLRFATGPEALWSGNFRDLAASVTRLVTLAEAGRIGESLVQAEVARLRWLWQPQGAGAATTPDSEAALPALVGAAVWDAMDLFDRLQLQAVARVCRRARSLSDAGRVLFQASRTQRSVVNDADRLRKYLARFGLTWEQVAGA